MRFLERSTFVDTTESEAAPVIATQESVLHRPDPRYCYENAVIAERLKAHDPQILDELIRLYQHRLMRYLLHLTGNRELAEDLFQETWMRVLVRGSQFQGKSQFVTWLFTIARNLVFDLRRKGSLTRSFEEITETGDERSFRRTTREQTPFDRCAKLESGRLITQALSALTPRQREVFVLRFQEALPLQEIATVTGMPLSTVKARLYRGLVVLKSHITRTRVSGHESALGITSGTGQQQSPLIPQWVPA
jgi:RNA polymerase sigma-70 factor (ECF subfamily)